MSSRLPDPTPSQQAALDAIAAFIAASVPIFLLRGSAGTGKTTLINHVVHLLDQRHRACQLVAPTGRAARILGARTRRDATTIHGMIYGPPSIDILETAESANDPGMRWHFPLKQDDAGDTVFIVDESSMVGDKAIHQDVLRFGSGRLLADLLEFARIGRAGRGAMKGAKIIFVGDPAQLSPVGESLSPAMSQRYLKETFDLDCETHELTQVMRQQSGSAVLEHATTLRDAIRERRYNAFDVSPRGEEVMATSVGEAVETAVHALRTKSSCVLITYSNAEALKLNRAIRGRVWSSEDADLRTGDLLLVNKNSYRCGLSNGDLIRIRAVQGTPECRHHRLKVRNRSGRVEAHAVELRFRRARVAYRSGDGSTSELDCMLLQNLLDSPERELTPLEQRALLIDFRTRHRHLKPKTAAFNVAIRDDPYFNALHVKYGYAMTCHKAQGGEWDTAVVQFGDGRSRNEMFFRWAYTAITRAQRRLVTVGAPRFSATSGIDWGEAPAAPGDSGSPPEQGSMADPDWDRFCFTPGQEGLFAYHQALREAWGDLGISIQQLQHLPYLERYQLSCGKARARVQYHYRRNLKVSTIGAVPGAVSDPALLEQALGPMETALDAASSRDAELSDPFLYAFRQRLEQALAGTDIRVVTAEPLQYRLRVEFQWAEGRTRIDFCYNGRKQWTTAREVGGAGVAKALLERLQQVMEDTE